MTVVPLPLPASVPDTAKDASRDNGATLAPGGSFAGALANAGAALDRADAAERAFASGRGGLHEMVIERAQADVALSLAAAAASRVAQSLSTLLGMQI